MSTDTEDPDVQRYIVRTGIPDCNPPLPVLDTSTHDQVEVGGLGMSQRDGRWEAAIHFYSDNLGRQAFHNLEVDSVVSYAGYTIKVVDIGPRYMKFILVEGP